jgi:hypothetical protein
MADTANPLLPGWASKYLGNGQPLANIVIIDHHEASQVVAVAAKSASLSFPPAGAAGTAPRRPL